VLGALIASGGMFIGAYLYHKAAHNKPPTFKLLPQPKHKVIAAKRDEDYDE
jgi:hypothetical protein